MHMCVSVTEEVNLLGTIRLRTGMEPQATPDDSVNLFMCLCYESVGILYNYGWMLKKIILNHHFMYFRLFQAIELGDALEVKYTGWLWTNNGFGKVSEMLSLQFKQNMFT